MAGSVWTDSSSLIVSDSQRAARAGPRSTACLEHYILSEWISAQFQDEFVNIYLVDKMKDYLRHYRSHKQPKLNESQRLYYLQNHDRITDSKRRHYHHSKPRAYERSDSQLQIKESKRLESAHRKAFLSENLQQYHNEVKAQLKEAKRLYYLKYKGYINESHRQYRLRNHENPIAFLERSQSIKSWKTPHHVRQFFDSIAKQLHISHFTDWYRISRQQIRALGGMLSNLIFMTTRCFLVSEVRGKSWSGLTICVSGN